MNWGHKLTIVIALFLITIISMVIFASQQTNEMVDANYYQKELRYQDIIDAKKNLLAVTDANLVTQDAATVFVHFPEGTYTDLLEGMVELLRPDSKAKDIILRMEPKDYGRKRISKNDLSKGMYRARLDWKAGGKAYYKEEMIYVE
jgi:nitrogen fixation protein FixH